MNGGETLGVRLRRERTIAPSVAATLLRRATAALERAERPQGSLVPGDLWLVPPDGVEVRPAPPPRDDAPYRAPEERPDARSDVYALGCLFYQMLVGVPPFPGPDLSDLVEQHRFAPPPRPGRARLELARFDALVRRALAKLPAERFQSLAELAAAIPPDPPASAHPSRRWIVAGLLVTLAAGATAALVFSPPPPVPPPVLPDAAPARRLLEPVVTIGACRGDDAAPPVANDALRPFPTEELFREQRRKGVPGFLRQHQPELARCYRAALARVPPPAALVWLRLGLRPDGTVASAAAAGLGDVAVEACLAAAARRVRFAAPATGSAELRCPVALAYAGPLPADARAVRIEDDGAPPRLASGDVPARRREDNWEALGVIIGSEPASPSVAVGRDEDLPARFAALRNEFADAYAIELVPAPDVRWARVAEAMVAARQAGFPLMTLRVP